MKASKLLVNLVNEWADSYIKSVDLPPKIIELASHEGLTPEETRKLVEKALLKRGLSARRIREILPDELKDKSKANISQVRISNAAKSAASLEDLELEKELDNMTNVPVTTPDAIIYKTEGEIAAEQYQKDQKEEQYTAQIEVQPLIDKGILTAEQVLKWSNDQYQNTFQIPKDINITMGAYHERLSPIQAVAQIKQLGNSVKALEIGWRILA